MRLYLIRHGQSVNNLLWTETQSDRGRSFDPELTPTGQAQARCVANFMRDELGDRMPFGGLSNDAARPSLLYTSLMTRAVETGHIVAQALNVPLIALDEAFEVGGLYLADEATGERVSMAGPDRDHFQKNFPALILPGGLVQGGWYNRPAETREERPLRVVRVWNDLMTRHGTTDEIVGLITHGGFYNYLLAHLLQIPVGDNVWFALNNCAITRMDLSDRGLALVFQNRFDFLPPALIT